MYATLAGTMFPLFYICRFVDVWDGVAFCIALACVVLLRDRLPHKHVLTLKMMDKMFYEVVTRTPQEAEIIQGHVNEAMARYKETHQP